MSERVSRVPISKSAEQLLVSLLVILIGVFYLTTVGPGHAWGGDFSQYIHHAKNISLGMPYDQTGYIYSPYNPELGPLAYPLGFPLLLSPVYRIFGLSFFAFKIAEIMFLLASLAVFWFLFRGRLSGSYRVALLCLFAFNPWTVSFKENVLSDIPFMFFIYLTFACISSIFERDDLRLSSGALLVVLIWFSSLVRTPGLLLIPALLTFDIYKNKRISGFTVLVVLSSTTLILASQLFFDGGATYLDQMRLWKPQVIFDNLISYTKELSSFWPQMTSSPYSTVTIFLLANSAALWGLVKLRHRLTIAEFFLIPYVVLILIWPARQGMRFLLPLIPLYLLYVLVGVDSFSRLLKVKVSQVTFFTFLSIIVLVSYGLGLQMVVKQLSSVPDGPFIGQAMDLFSFVESQTEPDAVFVFRKPRVLSLFADRSATVYSHQDDETNLGYFSDVGVTHVVVDLDADEDKKWLVPLMTRNPDLFQKVFENGRFAVFCFGNRSISYELPPEIGHFFGDFKFTQRSSA